MHVRKRWFFVALLCIPSGCQTQAPPVADNAVPAVPAKSLQPSEQPAMPLSVVTAASYSSELAKLRGQVVLVDMWATW